MRVFFDVFPFFPFKNSKKQISLMVRLELALNYQVIKHDNITHGLTELNNDSSFHLNGHSYPNPDV